MDEDTGGCCVCGSGFLSVKNWLAVSCRVFYFVECSKTDPGNPTSSASDSHFAPSGPNAQTNEKP